MKIILSFLFLIVLQNTSYGQAYKAGFKKDMCECLEEESLKRQLTDNIFKRCLRETLPKYATQIDVAIVEEDINKKFQKGQLARKDLLVSMHSELIYSCDVYYKHIDFQYTSKKLIARENAKESDLEKYNEMVALSPTAMTYFMRAQIYFKLGKIKETEADINKSLSLNPNKENGMATRQELLLLASVYQEQEKYSEAVALYDKIYFGDLDTQVAQLRALADKKSGGSYSGLPQIRTKEPQANTRSANRGRTQNSTRSKSSSTNRTKNEKVKKKDTASLRKLLKIGNG